MHINAEDFGGCNKKVAKSLLTASDPFNPASTASENCTHLHIVTGSLFDVVVPASKVEYLNPGGTSKDRVAANMIAEAEAGGVLKAGGTVVEGTSGSTGICLASLCRAKGYRCVIVMPDDQVRRNK